MDLKAVPGPPYHTGGPPYPAYPTDEGKHGLSILDWIAGQVVAGLAANPELVDLTFTNRIINPPPPGEIEVLDATEYTFTTKTTEPPSGGMLCFDNAIQPSATKVWVHTVDALNTDISITRLMLIRIKIGDELYIQDKADSTFYQSYVVSAAAISKGTYYEIPVTFKAGGGALGNNARVLFIILATPAPKLDANGLSQVAYTLAAHMVDVRGRVVVDPTPPPPPVVEAERKTITAADVMRIDPRQQLAPLVRLNQKQPPP